MTARILIIAGSDSGGGAGIQADIKTVTMLGGHAMTAITAITAQNTLGVSAVHPVPTDMVIAQIDAVLSDIGADAIKIGMIGSAETAHAVAKYLAVRFCTGLSDSGDSVWLPRQLQIPIVFDPVMLATSGDVLANADTIEAFRLLLQVATLVTPNLPELKALGGKNAILRYGCDLLIKGGHGKGSMITDRLITTHNEYKWSAKRIKTRHTHGTGCTLASAVTTSLGKGCEVIDAVEHARHFVRMSILESPNLGSGNGPLGQQNVKLDSPNEDWEFSPMMNQVTVHCSDYAESVRFYQGLGLKLIVDSPPHYARFETHGGATFSIESVAEGLPPSATVYFEFEHLDEVVEGLKRRRIAFDLDAKDQNWLWREARLRDPHGNRLCLYRAGENRRYPPWRI